MSSTTEPVLTTSTITALAAAVVTLFVSFGLPLSDTQTIAISGFVAVVAPLVAGVLTRRQVTPSVQVAVKAEGGDLVAADALPLANGTPVVVQYDDNHYEPHFGDDIL